jgi:hypothetical protein
VQTEASVRAHSREEAKARQDRGSQRVDLYIRLPHSSLGVDVSITNPTCASYVLQSSRSALYAVKVRENEKKSRYAGAYDNFFPFVADSYGAFGNKAIELLQILRKESEDASAHRPLMYYLRRMAIVLQRGNAEIFRSAFNQHLKSSPQGRHDCDFLKLSRDSAALNPYRLLA